MVDELRGRRSVAAVAPDQTGVNPPGHLTPIQDLILGRRLPPFEQRS